MYKGSGLVLRADHASPKREGLTKAERKKSDERAVGDLHRCVTEEGSRRTRTVRQLTTAAILARAEPRFRFRSRIGGKLYI
jgi:hypothetical protein